VGRSLSAEQGSRRRLRRCLARPGVRQARAVRDGVLVVARRRRRLRRRARRAVFGRFGRALVHGLRRQLAPPLPLVLWSLALARSLRVLAFRSLAARGLVGGGHHRASGVGAAVCAAHPHRRHRRLRRLAGLARSVGLSPATRAAFLGGIRGFTASRRLARCARFSAAARSCRGATSLPRRASRGGSQRSRERERPALPVRLVEDGIIRGGAAASDEAGDSERRCHGPNSAAQGRSGAVRGLIRAYRHPLWMAPPPSISDRSYHRRPFRQIWRYHCTIGATLHLASARSSELRRGAPVSLSPAQIWYE
jgi:hypothetical protein